MSHIKGCFKVMKNYLKEINYNERKGFLNRKIEFNIDTIKPIREDVVTKIKNQFLFADDFDLTTELEDLRVGASFVKFKDDSIPRQAEKNKLLSSLSNSIKSLVESIENLDDYTFLELLNLLEEEIPGVSEYIDNKLSNHIKKILNVIEENNSAINVGGPKKQNLKSFIVYKLLSIYWRGVNKKIVSYSTAHKESGYGGDAFDFLSMCNEYLELELGSPHNIAILIKFYTTRNKT